MRNRRFLLSRLVKEEIERSSSQGLEAALAEECRKLASTGFRIPDKEGRPTSNPVTIDRRKLDRIAAGDEGVNLRLWELRLLASYFERNQGIDLSETPVFEKLSFYEPLTKGGKVSFLFGLRPEASERANSLRLWDLRSMTVIAEEAYQTGHRLELDWRFVETAPANILEGKSEGWNFVSIGSPRANVATEVLLAKMFGVAPFQSEPGHPRLSFPFSFVWAQPLRSTFATPVTSLQATVGADELAALKSGRASAMLINGRAHVVENSYTEATIPGVIAAQRMIDERIVVVVAGLSGPATFGAATLLKDLAAELPPASADPDHAAVMWAAIEVHVVAKADAFGDTRVPDKWEFITTPEVWSPAGKLATSRKQA